MRKLPFHDDGAKVNLLKVSALQDGHLCTFNIQDPYVDMIDLQIIQQMFNR